MTLDPVTIRLDAERDLRAAGLPASEADALAAVYTQAAQAICEGFAEVRVVGGSDAGCDAEWARDYGLWQAAHDCCRRDGGRWTLNAAAVELCRRGLRKWIAPSDRTHRLYCEARASVEGDEQLAPYSETILTDYPEGDEHWRWVIDAPADEIVSWARRAAQ